MAKDFTVTVYGERGEEFKQIFGTNEVNVLLPWPQMARMADKDQSQLCYLLDADLLTPSQHEALVTHLAKKFMSSETEVRTFLAQEGLPILASDTIVTVTNPQSWMLDDLMDTDEIEALSELDEFDDDFDGYSDYA